MKYPFVGPPPPALPVATLKDAALKALCASEAAKKAGNPKLAKFLLKEHRVLLAKYDASLLDFG